MNFWTFVFLCVVAGIAYDMWRKKHLSGLGHWEGSDGTVQPLDRAREGDLQREVEELRERVKVLERIATENHEPARLAAEIERLRDK